MAKKKASGATPAYEKASTFYLGKGIDPGADAPRDDLLLYDAKDLTTHGMCVGMTGSGKTGLCLSLLEEAAIDGIPAIAIDPKGDLGNLMLTFPKLSPSDFEPWVDEGEALRKGMDKQAYAKRMADLWKNGLADWGQDGARIQRFRDAVDLSIYTPGSSAGRQLTVLRSFSAPAEAVRGDNEAMRERVSSSVSSLLCLLGVDADPIQSREHILLSTILHNAWTEGTDLSLAAVIQKIQKPGVDRIGVFDLESFFPEKDRFALAMTINNLLAAPAFGAWLEGEPLDIQRLLWTDEGKPRLSIISIAHLNESERMFFVTLLLSEVVAWMRGQSGSTSLRAIVYMDEVFGFLPPTANPPSKLPMLTMLKQARAYGVGMMLATQNPVDLDYKALSNMGTWFLGRLQTERDKMRILDGLEGASRASGAFNRAEVEATLSGLKSRVFLMNNVHDDGPMLFHTRWALSYLRGPLTRQQIKVLSGQSPAPAKPVAKPATKAAKAATKREVAKADGAVPVLPPGIEARYVVREKAMRDGQSLLYRPALMAQGRLHFVNARRDIDQWDEEALFVALEGKATRPDLWADATPLGTSLLEVEDEPEEGARFGELPGAATKKTSYTSWKKRLKDHFYRERTLMLFRCPALKLYSEAGESEGDFRARMQLAIREKRDEAIEKLKNKYRPKLERLDERIRKSEQKVDKEQEQYEAAKSSSVMSWGKTILGAVLGRKLGSIGNVSRAGTAMSRSAKIAKEKEDVRRASEDLDTAVENLEEMEKAFEADLDELKAKYADDALEIEDKPIRPRKSDIDVTTCDLVWLPWIVDGDGVATPGFEIES